MDLSNFDPKFLILCGVDPFGGAKPRLLRRGKEAPLRVNPEQAQALRPGSRRVDLRNSIILFLLPFKCAEDLS
jgi:hypothetical protein